MTNPTDNHHGHDQGWSTYSTTQSTENVAPQDDQADGRKDRHGHGAHKWMMLLMCAPVLLMGIWSFASGAGWGGLFGGLMCAAMMAVMHLGMGGGRHRH